MPSLAIANPRGQFTQLLAKVAAIEKKYGRFGALFILGDLFATGDQTEAIQAEEGDLLSGKVSIPLPTYFYLSGSPLPERLRTAVEGKPAPNQVVKNLIYLGKSGVAEVSGLRVAFCGGKWDGGAWRRSFEGAPEHDEQDTHMTYQSVQRLLSDPSFVSIPSPVNSDQLQQPQTLAEARKMAALNLQAVEAASKAQDAEASRPILDILLANAWPAGITNLSADAPNGGREAPPLAELARRGKPRYIFGTSEQAGDGTWWERAPYENSASVKEAQYPTRFVSLAAFANAAKKKWFMAIALVPGHARPEITRAVNATASPFLVSGPKRQRDEGDNFRFTKRSRPGSEYVCHLCGVGGHFIKDCSSRSKVSEGYVCRICSSNEHLIRDCPSALGERDERPPKGYVCKVCGSNEHYLRLCPQRSEQRRERHEVLRAVAPEDCWFCLSNPRMEAHLVAHIGEEVYLALPKGQLPRADATEVGGADAGVPGGGHVLILPIAHVASLHTPGVEDALRSEMERYRSALSKMYASYAAVPFSWEIGRTSHTRAGHMQVQVVPVGAGQAKGLSAALREAAHEHGWEFLEGEAARRFLCLAPMDDEGEPTAMPDYVRIDIGSDTFAMNVSSKTRFPLSFPRTFLADYLGVPERADWKTCANSQAVERAETEEFKDAFQEWAGDVEV